ncbi:MAG: type II secretion system F family protein, partial [Betaproteobacteria bacterium]|nr:type II secretion system F family protein [Betaproteobacteria bacterium]
MEFRYRAVNAQGQASAGQIGAASEREAVRLLQHQDLTPIEIAPLGADAAPVSTGTRLKRVKGQDKAVVIRELATLLKAGVSLAEAVYSIGQTHTDTGLGHTFGQVHGRLRGGESFSAAMRAADTEWPDYVFQL